jgi:hypothetical protein
MRIFLIANSLLSRAFSHRNTVPKPPLRIGYILGISPAVFHRYCRAVAVPYLKELSGGSVFERIIVAAFVVWVAVVAADFSMGLLCRIGMEILSSCCPATEMKFLFS